MTEMLPLLNLITASGLVILCLFGVAFMYRVDAYQRAGKYGLWGLFFIVFAKWFASAANVIPGPNPEFAAVIFFLQTAGFILISTHVAHNVRKYLVRKRSH